MALTDVEKDLESGLEVLDRGVSRHRNGAIRLAIAGIFLLIASLNFGGGSVSASTYGSSGYGGCGYNTGCDTVAVPSTDNSASAEQTTELGAANAPLSTININKYTDRTNNSYTLSGVTASQQVKFSITTSNGKLESHVLTVETISSDSVKITLASTPETYVLKLNQSIRVDLNQDGIPELGVELSVLDPPTANIKIWHIVSTATQVKSQTILGTAIKLISSVAAITISAYEFIVLGRTHHM